MRIRIQYFQAFNVVSIYVSFDIFCRKTSFLLSFFNPDFHNHVGDGYKLHPSHNIRGPIEEGVA